MYYNKNTGGFYDSSVNKVIPEGSVEITKEQHSEFLSQMSSTRVLDIIDGVVQLVDIPKSKEALLAEAKATRDNGQYGNIEVSGMIFDANEQSQRNIEVAIRKFDLVSTDGFVYWTLADNTIIPLTLEQLISVEDAITLRFNQLHTDYTMTKMALQAEEPVTEEPVTEEPVVEEPVVEEVTP